MADWYVSSAAYTAIPAWTASTAYTVGQIVRPTAPNAWQRHPMRCTTAGTSGGTEPGWQFSNNATTTSGTAVFTCVSGQSTYGWSAAAGNLYSLSNFNFNRPVAGDRLFVSSDHSESFAGSTTWAYSSAGFGLIQFLSVNRAGSVPPVAADLLAGASITTTSGNLIIDSVTNTYWQGFTFTVAGANNLLLNSAGTKALYLKNCALALTSASAGCRVGIQAPLKTVLDNTTIQFAHASQTFQSAGAYTWDLTWINTPSALLGTMPTSLFTATTALIMLLTARGVDLSAFSGTLLNTAASAATCTKILLDSCKIASAMTRFGTPGVNSTNVDEVELINCFDSTDAVNERYTPAGTITTDRSTTMTGGAQDDIGAYSIRMVSSTRSTKFSGLLECFWFDVENTATGSSKTATVEIISSATLNDDEISLLLEYMGTSGSSVASVATTLPSPLATPAALPSSSVTWTSPPATPQKQYLSVAFTPERAGRVRGLVRLGKVSTTVWVNPQITIT